MAYVLYGKKFARLTSFCNLACLLGFAMSFIVYVSNHGIVNVIYQKESIPDIIMNFRDDKTLPNWLNNSFEGGLFWGTIYTV